jgi:septin family protein
LILHLKAKWPENTQIEWTRGLRHIAGSNSCQVDWRRLHVQRSLHRYTVISLTCVLCIHHLDQKGLNGIYLTGETGIGKSTLIDTLFNTKFDWTKSTHFEPKVRLNKNTYDLTESNVKLRLTIVETLGFGDQIDKDESHRIISSYLDDQFESYLQEELKIKRNFDIINDTRIHVCLYFICPTGHSLKSLDLLMMKNLDKKVNIIPVIAKADTIAKNELIKFKQKIMSDLTENNVNIYQFPVDDDTVADINKTMNVRLHMDFVHS